MQGRYEILSLSGSYLLQDTGGGGRLRTGGLSVSLAGTDGRVIGGGVAGLLVAASPIQVAILVDMGYLFFMIAFHVVMSLLHSNPGGVKEMPTCLSCLLALVAIHTYKTVLVVLWWKSLCTVCKAFVGILQLKHDW